jgi:hypothetical protein
LPAGGRLVRAPVRELVRRRTFVRTLRVGAVKPPAHLSNWTGELVAAECRKAYNAYRTTKTESYRTFFTVNAHLRADDHEYKALDLPAALPDD